MFQIDDRNIKKLERKLKDLNERALPFATRATLNETAFRAQRISKSHVGRKMVNRNRWTQQSIQVERAKGLNIRSQRSFVGSVADYMEKQEFGHTEQKRGSEGVPIATSFSSGEGRARPRMKLPRKPNKRRNIRLRAGTIASKTRKQKNVIKIRQAAQSGLKYVFLDLGRRKGIFKVVGGKRKPRIEMVWDLTRPSVTIPATPWLRPSTDKAVAFIPRAYKKALLFQLKRLT